MYAPLYIRTMETPRERCHLSLQADRRRVGSGRLFATDAATRDPANYSRNFSRIERERERKRNGEGEGQGEVCREEVVCLISSNESRKADRSSYSAR